MITARERRTRVTELVDTLLEQLDAQVEPTVVVRKVPADGALLRAVAKLADAVVALDQAKFAGLREVGARMELERAARSVVTAYRNREARHGSC